MKIILGYTLSITVYTLKGYLTGARDSPNTSFLWQFSQHMQLLNT